MIIYALAGASLPRDIGGCQYRRVSNSLTVISPAETAACCSPLTAQPLSIEQAEQVAPLLKALADPVRLRLMSLVASREGGEACICDLNDGVRPVPADDQPSHEGAARGRAGGPGQARRMGLLPRPSRRPWPAWAP